MSAHGSNESARSHSPTASSIHSDESLSTKKLKAKFHKKATLRRKRLEVEAEAEHEREQAEAAEQEAPKKKKKAPPKKAPGSRKRKRAPTPSPSFSMEGSVRGDDGRAKRTPGQALPDVSDDLPTQDEADQYLAGRPSAMSRAHKAAAVDAANARYALGKSLEGVVMTSVALADRITKVKLALIDDDLSDDMRAHYEETLGWLASLHGSVNGAPLEILLLDADAMHKYRRADDRESSASPTFQRTSQAEEHASPAEPTPAIDRRVTRSQASLLASSQ